MRTTRPSKKPNFGFSEHMWNKVPQGAEARKTVSRSWYLTRCEDDAMVSVSIHKNGR